MTVEAAWPQTVVTARADDPSDGSAVLALDLGASRIRAAVVAADGTVLARETRPTPVLAGPTAVVDACVTALAAVRRDPAVSARPLGGLGVSAPGPLDAASATLLEPPNLGPAFHDLRLGDALARATGLDVVMERDTNVAALAERAFGSARGEDDFLYLTVSTGIGGAIVAGGRLFRGPDGLAGELGHVLVELDGPLCGCGARGHLEAVSSGSGIAAQALERVAAGEAPGLAAFAARSSRTDRGPQASSTPASWPKPRRPAIPPRPPSCVAPGGASPRRSSASSMSSRRTSWSSAAASPAPRANAGWRLRGRPWPPSPSASWRRRTRIVAAALGDDVGLAGAVPLLALRPNSPS